MAKAAAWIFFGRRLALALIADGSSGGCEVRPVNDAGRVLLVVRGELPSHGPGRTWERSCPCTGAPSGAWLAHYGTPGSCRPARAGPFIQCMNGSLLIVASCVHAFMICRDVGR